MTPPVDPIRVCAKVAPPLDPGFVPAALWTRAYRAAVEACGRGRGLALRLERPGGAVSVFRTKVFPHEGAWAEANRLHVDRLLKFLLWQKGGRRIVVAGEPALAAQVREAYSEGGARSFDRGFMGEQVYGGPMSVEAVPFEEAGESAERPVVVSRGLDGCRIGFDLGGSDRKCAALVDGKVVFSEEVVWDPYPNPDPDWHRREIDDSLRRAAARLPRVDGIGGSAAGIYIGNEVRVASLFRGVSREDFRTKVRRIFFELQKDWGGVPLVVLNDGEVTALAGSMSLGGGSVLGVAMGTSEAAGYVGPDGNLTEWLNELAFAPIDYRREAPADEWSGDRGCGVQYLSQQAVGRLLPASGIRLEPGMTLPQRLAAAQALADGGDARARLVFETVGVYLGYAIAHYADFYELGKVLVLGRVVSGKGGEAVLAAAGRVLREEFPELHSRVGIATLGERDKRHGQAIAAASLPSVPAGGGS